MKRPRWFAAKEYGWGWYPVTWQGWLILTLFIAFVVWRFAQIDSQSHSMSDTLIAWIPEEFVALLVLIAICWLTGDSPRWRWGKD